MEDRLSDITADAVSLNHQDRAAFIQKSKQLQSIILNGSTDDLNEFIDALDDIGERSSEETQQTNGSGSAEIN